MKYYSATKRKGIPIHTTRQIILGSIMQSKISQIQEENIAWFHIYEISRMGKLMEAEGRIKAIRGVGDRRS